MSSEERDSNGPNCTHCTYPCRVGHWPG